MNKRAAQDAENIAVARKNIEELHAAHQIRQSDPRSARTFNPLDVCASGTKLRRRFPRGPLSFDEGMITPPGVVAARLALAIGDPIPEWALGDIERWKPIAREMIKRAEIAYRNTGNLMCAFEAFMDARVIGDPFPEWVLVCLDVAIFDFQRSFADWLDDMRANPRHALRYPQSPGGPPPVRPCSNGTAHRQPGEALAEAFGIKGGKGEKTLWEEHAWSVRDDLLPWDIAQAMLDFAQQEAAEGKPINEKAVLAGGLARLSLRKSNGKPISLSTARRAWKASQRDAPELASAVLDLLPGKGSFIKSRIS